MLRSWSSLTAKTVTFHRSIYIALLFRSLPRISSFSTSRKAYSSFLHRGSHSLSSILSHSGSIHKSKKQPLKRSILPSQIKNHNDAELFSTRKSTADSSDGSGGANLEPPQFPCFANIPDTDLHPDYKRILAKMGLKTMTEIQTKTFAPALAGKDILGRARTGTGKTLAFLLPAVQRLSQNIEQLDDLHNNKSIHMVILSPTRELAAQIAEQARQLLSTNGRGRTDKSNSTKKIKKMSYQVVYGGTKKERDTRAFETRVPTILVATPGRLLDHIETTNLFIGGRRIPFSKLLSQTSILVLDETDRLLDMGFRREVEKITRNLPAKENRQTLLFSATLPEDVKTVMDATMNRDYVTVDCIHDKDPASHTNAQVQQKHVILPSNKRLMTGTVEILHKLIHGEEQQGQKVKLVVFLATAHLVKHYAALFQKLGLDIPVMELHSRKSQAFRTRMSDAFRKAESAVLFTSDVSARGVDYPGVSHVVQVGMADSRESYIHRLGRTGRAGKMGEGLLVLSDMESNFLTRHLGGLDVPVHREMQDAMDGPACSVVMNKLDPVLESIRTQVNSDLTASVHSAYRSMLGYYNGKLQKMGYEGADHLVEFCNRFALQAGCVEIPELELKLAKKMGLSSARGLNIAKNERRYKNNNKSTNSNKTRFESRPQQQRYDSGGRGPPRGRGSQGKDDSNGNRRKQAEFKRGKSIKNRRPTW